LILNCIIRVLLISIVVKNLMIRSKNVQRLLCMQEYSKAEFDISGRLVGF